MCCAELSLRGMPRHFYANGNFVFDRQGEECGRLDFEVGQGSGNRTRKSDIGGLLYKLKRHVLIMRSLACELNFDVRLNACGGGGRFRQAGPDSHHRELGSAGDLHHVKIAIAVARIKRFHGHSDEEVALSGMADALATSGVADAIRLMERVRDLIGESALLETPLGIGG